jgi:PIN domain nuclease of toxin-antitoxin system
VIVLDTHALVWWVADPAQIPAKGRRLIQAALGDREKLHVSSISLWEIALLLEHGRLTLSVDSATWLAAIQSLPFVNWIPVDNAIALRSVSLERFPHRDPADRFIVATALATGATLVTGDRRLRGYSPLSTAWD